MNAERLKQIEEIYHAALKIAPDEREFFFREHCGEDENLRREVESLLSFENASGNFIDTPPESLAAEMFSEREKQIDFISKEIGHYRIVSKIGAGGMGEVFLARDTKLDRKVALKILPPKFAGDKDRMSRFIREAKSASALNHPNIITIYEIGEAGGIHFIATEFIDGKTLNKYSKNNPLDYKSALEIAIQIASALDEAHVAGIVHRDVKPDNVMVRANGLVKILDFGIAKLTEQKPETIDAEAATAIKSGTNPGMIIGTPNYMSPEQARGKTVDGRSDIFSFGIVLYEMLSGKLPFAGESPMDVLGAILHKEPPPLKQFTPELPDDIEQIVSKTLQKNTDERYQTTKDLLTDLRRVKQRLEYEEVGRSFPPENSKADVETQKTRIFNSSASGQIISAISMANAPPNNLSGEILNLIGREAETAEIMDLLRESDVRLLTITGVGGTGKTRLANTISQLSLAEFADGVYYVALAPIDNHELVVPIIGQTLDVREEAGKPLIECLHDYLRGKKMLIVLDNFEQVTEAASQIGELLAGSQILKILVTSRVRLNLKHEREFTLQPLGVPADERLTANELGKYPAVELFVKSAKAAKFDFALTEENAASIAEICRQLDGLPLAIELAAARVKLFAPAAIIKRLEHSLNLLTGGAKDLPERQQTMRGAIAWSYDLLDADEKKLLNRLSVFRGGLTLDGAEEVGNAESDLSVDLLDVVSSLVDKSLLVQREQKDGEPRFRMLVVVREFAFEKLAESGEADEIKRLHAEFYAALAEKADPELEGAKAAEWLETLALEHDNLRAAIEWSLDKQPETALQIVGSLYKFWLRSGYSAEGSRWTRAVLEKNGEQADAALRAKTYRNGGLLSLRQGDFKLANSLIKESLRLSREIGDKSLICYALTCLGAVRLGEGNLTESLTFTKECLAIARETDDKFQISVSLNRLGEISRQKEDYPAARQFYEEAYAIAKRESMNAAAGAFANNLADVLCLLEDYPNSLLYALESLKACEESGNKTAAAGALESLAALAVKTGEIEKAARLFGAAQSIYEAEGYKLEKADLDFKNRYINEARAAIGDEAFDAAHAQGLAMSMKDAIASARESESNPQSETAAAHITNDAPSGATIVQAADKTDQPHTDDSLMKKTIGASSAEYVVGQTKKRRFVAAAAAILVAAFLAFGYLGFLRPQTIDSIAVLPFVNTGDDRANEFLSDGLTDNLINALSRLPQLKVISRSSSFRFRGENVDVQEAAQKLNVAAILTGRVVRRGGEDLQISVELINAADNTRIWGEIYNRKISGASNVPEEIAQAVAEKLNLKLSDAQQRQIKKHITDNPQAYQFHLNGVFFRRKNGAENIRAGIEYQKQALALDPNFTLAYVELSINYGNLVDIGAMSPQEGLPPARAAIEQALVLDDTLADVHYNIGRIRRYEFQWTKAEQSFRRAIELNPNLAAAHTLYAEFLSSLGRFDEALREIRLAQELDPLRTGLIGNEGSIFYRARQFDEAIAKARIHASSATENPFAHLNLANAYVENGQFAEALAAYQTSIKLEETASALIYLGRFYALTGKPDEAAAIVEKLNSTKKYVSPVEFAILYAALGEREKAFAALEKGFGERDVRLTDLKVEPGYDSLRNDSRFQELLRRIGF